MKIFSVLIKFSLGLVFFISFTSIAKAADIPSDASISSESSSALSSESSSDIEPVRDAKSWTNQNVDPGDENEMESKASSAANDTLGGLNENHFAGALAITVFIPWFFVFGVLDYKRRSFLNSLLGDTILIVLAFSCSQMAVESRDYWTFAGNFFLTLISFTISSIILGKLLAQVRD